MFIKKLPIKIFKNSFFLRIQNHKTYPFYILIFIKTSKLLMINLFSFFYFIFNCNLNIFRKKWKMYVLIVTINKKVKRCGDEWKSKIYLCSTC